MSLGYASRLSFREDLGGRLGAPEHRDSEQNLKVKIDRLTEMIRESRKTVVFTGAGISTSCGIPDFRGPRGVWTLQRKGKEPPKLSTPFCFAVPSLTHQALLRLVDIGRVDYVVSQNVDGLHRRSGLNPEKLAELHGNCFSEKCSVCKTEYFRDFEMDTVGFRWTGRRCAEEGCSARLRDNILDWEDPLPEDKLEISENVASSATLAICLGTSLQIIPACDLPLKTVQSGGRLVIVNLQKTPKDSKADLVIHAEVDKVISRVMQNLKLEIPPFLRVDQWIILHRQGTPSKIKGNSLILLKIVNTAGAFCPLPMIQSVKLKLVRSDGFTIKKECDQWPFKFKERSLHGKVEAFFTIYFAKELDISHKTVKYEFEVLSKADYVRFLRETRCLPLKNHSKSGHPIMKHKTFQCTTQEITYSTNAHPSTTDDVLVKSEASL